MSSRRREINRRRRRKPPRWSSIKEEGGLEGNPLRRCDICGRKQSADMIMATRRGAACDACWTHWRRHNTDEWREIISNLREDED